MPEYKKGSTKIKFNHWKSIRISEKAHLRPDFRKKNISLSGARTHEIITYFFRAGIEKYFRSFLVQMKTAKSPFKINWPLSGSHVR